VGAGELNGGDGFDLIPWLRTLDGGERHVDGDSLVPW
jgi:hypothetical protein